MIAEMDSADVLSFYRKYATMELPRINWGDGEISTFQKNDKLIFMLFYYADQIQDPQAFYRKVCELSFLKWFMTNYSKMTTNDLSTLAALVFKAYRHMQQGKKEYAPFEDMLMATAQCN